MTFLFTDIEGSTELLRRIGTDAFDAVLVEHGRLMREALCGAGAGGREVRVEGDSFFVAFSSAPNGVAAAVAAQRALAAHRFPEGTEVRVRMGLHTGEGRPAAAEAGADYVGIDVHRAARIAAAAHGSQIVISETTRSLVRDSLPAGVTTKDLGDHRLKDFAQTERIHQLVIEGLPSDFPPLRTLDRAPNNLPVQLTSFVGRKQVAEASALLRDGTRLLTLTGPGGTGKTRLSIEVAGEVLDAFPDGVYWVPLAAISDVSLVVPTIATSLGLHAAGAKPVAEVVAEHLRDRSTLLVLDNFEQLLSAAAFVSDLLKAAPKVKAIVSSRAPLRIYGEREFPVPPLSLPDRGAGLEALSQSEAVRLFVERAVATRPDFQVTAQNARAVVELCARLDGLPLAIELAAARVKILPPEAILERLGQSLDVLSGGARDLPDRQRTLRGAIAWSYDLLDGPTRRLFERLAIFVGGAWLEQIEKLCAEGLGGDVLDLLTGLVDHSLIRQRDIDGAPRFQMLVTIREYAIERLEAGGEAEAIRRRHAEAYLALAQYHAPELTGPKQRQCLDELDRDHDNIRAAMEWAIGSDPRMAMRFVHLLWRFWHMRGHLEEAEVIVRRVLALPFGDDLLPDRLRALDGAGGVAYWAGDLEAGGERYRGALELAERLGDAAQVAEQNYNVSFIYQIGMSDLPRARVHIDRAVDGFRRLGDSGGIAKVLWAKGNLLALLEDLDGAASAIDEATRMFRERDDRFGLGWALHLAALLGLRRGDLAGARRSADEALRIFEAAGDVSGVTLVVTNHSGIAWLEGDRERAVRIFAAAEHLSDVGGGGLIDRTEGWWAQLFEPIRNSGPEYATARAEGSAMDRAAAVAYALGQESAPIH